MFRITGFFSTTRNKNVRKECYEYRISAVGRSHINNMKFIKSDYSIHRPYHNNNNNLSKNNYSYYQLYHNNHMPKSDPTDIKLLNNRQIHQMSTILNRFYSTDNDKQKNDEQMEISYYNSSVSDDKISDDKISDNKISDDEGKGEDEDKDKCSMIIYFLTLVTVFLWCIVCPPIGFLLLLFVYLFW